MERRMRCGGGRAEPGCPQGEEAFLLLPSPSQFLLENRPVVMVNAWRYGDALLKVRLGEIAWEYERVFMMSARRCLE